MKTLDKLHSAARAIKRFQHKAFLYSTAALVCLIVIPSVLLMVSVAVVMNFLLGIVGAVLAIPKNFRGTWEARMEDSIADMEDNIRG